MNQARSMLRSRLDTLVARYDEVARELGLSERATHEDVMRLLRIRLGGSGQDPDPRTENVVTAEALANAAESIKQDIEVLDHGVEIINAPEEAQISLALLVGADPRVVRLRGGMLLLGSTGVRYWVKGYNQDRCTLKLSRLS